MRKYSSPVVFILIIFIVIGGYFLYQSYERLFHPSDPKQSISIDLSKSTQSIVINPVKDKDVFSLEFELAGTSNVNISFSIGENEQSIHQFGKLKQGEIDFTYQNDWYSDTLFLEIIQDG